MRFPWIEYEDESSDERFDRDECNRRFLHNCLMTAAVLLVVGLVATFIIFGLVQVVQSGAGAE